MVFDYRYANSQVRPTLGFLPLLDVALRHLQETGWFGSMDAFKRVWQFPWAKESEEIHSFLTECGVHMPTRFLQGSTDSSGSFRGHGLFECTYMDL